MGILIGVVFFIIAWVLLAKYQKKKRWEQRRAELLTKYGSAEIVRRIMDRMFWEGQTLEQLIDSIGRPIHPR